MARHSNIPRTSTALAQRGKVNWPAIATDAFISLIAAMGLVLLWDSEHNPSFLFAVVAPLLDTCLSFVDPAIFAIIPVFSAVAIFIYQTFFNRFSSSYARKVVSYEIVSNFVLSFVVIVTAYAFWLTGEKSVFLGFLLILLSIALSAKFFVFLLRTSRVSFSKHIQKIVQRATQSLSARVPTFRIVEGDLDYLRRYAHEAVHRREYTYLVELVDCRYQVFDQYLIRKDYLKTHCKEPEERLSEFEETFADDLIDSFVQIVGIAEGELVVEQYSSRVLKLLKRTIELEKLSLFKQAVSSLKSRIVQFPERVSQERANKILELLGRLYRFSLSREQSPKSMEEELEDILASSLFLNDVFLRNSEILKVQIVEVGRCLSKTLTSRGPERFQSFLKKATDGLVGIVEILDPSCAYILTVSLTGVVEDVAKLGSPEIAKSFADASYSILERLLQSTNDQVVRIFAHFCADFAQDFKAIPTISDWVIKRQTELGHKMITLKSRNSAILFPDFPTRIQENIGDQQLAREVATAYGETLRRAARSNETSLVTVYLDSLGKCLCQYSQDQKIQQEYLFDVVTDLLDWSLIYKSEHTFKYTMYFLSDQLKTLDNDRAVSENLALHILGELDEVSGNITADSDLSIPTYYCDILKNIPKDAPSVCRAKSVRKKIGDTLFAFGVRSVEAKNSQFVKIASNALGWFGVDAYDVADYETLKEVIGHGCSLFKLIQELDFDVAVRSFVGTLFIVIGGYLVAKRDTHVLNYVRTKVEGLPEHDALRQAKKLRTAIPGNWDARFGTSSTIAMSTFFDSLRLK